MIKLFTILFAISFSLSAQDEPVSVYFENDSHQLTQTEIEKLNPDSSWVFVKLIGYTDYLGTANHNLILSEKRAQEVEQFLLNASDLKEQNIQIIGKGELGRELSSRVGVPKNRRVDLIITRQISSPKPQIEKLDTSSNPTLVTKIKETEIGSNLILDNFSFVGGQHILVQESQPTLDSLILILTNNTSLKIAIEGHICCETQYPDGLDQQTGKYNLSEARAKYIYDVLVEEGISPSRLSYEGFARTKPIYEYEINATQQQANRRVEIKIIDK